MYKLEEVSLDDAIAECFDGEEVYFRISELKGQWVIDNATSVHIQTEIIEDDGKSIEKEISYIRVNSHEEFEDGNQKTYIWKEV